MGKCKKKKFETKELAEKFLIHAKEKRKKLQAQGKVSRRKEERSYWCIGCQGWHTSSWSQSKKDKVVKFIKFATEERIVKTAEFWLKKKGWE